MTEISAILVKTLREKTGAGMMDCKKALHEVNGDIEAATDWLRKKGLAAAAKKAGRVAAEGLVGVASIGTAAAVVEINAETDFIARNADFQALVAQTAEIAAKAPHTVESLASAAFKGESETVEQEITRLIAVIGENMSLRRVARLSVEQGIVATYIHSGIAPGLGRIGVLVALESAADPAKLEELGKKLAMHVAATQPQALSVDELDPTSVERERAILVEQARASGRPEDVIQKMVEGRLKKFYEEVVFLEQTYVVDGKTRIADAIEQAAKELGHPIELKAFTRFGLGEGIEKVVSDFAAEVQAQAGL
ncbi:translation elongation factor Ts [Candidatus Finniella inopinata]|uniref:Elongation factor Ts n=1 Tax=Candidatus Finniella inopinata TaxID=1696036 RepID=A0A4Q7DGJ7_9PROT|nr:translation elongation factor Ts [Candidatus Finniella inopinata]RZI45933.1 elongation factor Ts [Candidatus Finniella inopinata]